MDPPPVSSCTDTGYACQGILSQESSSQSGGGLSSGVILGIVLASTAVVLGSITAIVVFVRRRRGIRTHQPPSLARREKTSSEFYLSTSTSEFDGNSSSVSSLYTYLHAPARTWRSWPLRSSFVTKDMERAHCPVTVAVETTSVVLGAANINPSHDNTYTHPYGSDHSRYSTEYHHPPSLYTGNSDLQSHEYDISSPETGSHNPDPDHPSPHDSQPAYRAPPSAFKISEASADAISITESFHGAFVTQRDGIESSAVSVIGEFVAL